MFSGDRALRPSRSIANLARNSVNSFQPIGRTLDQADIMSTKTSIEWTEQTWNPAVGCRVENLPKAPPPKGQMGLFAEESD